MFCQKCGTQMSDTATSCPSCNNPVAPAASPVATAAPSPFPTPASPAPTGPSPASVAADKMKAASKDGVEALKTFAGNPVAGLAPASDGLGAGRVLGVGIAFGVVFALCLVFGVYRFLGEGSFKALGFGGFIKLLLWSFVPFVCLAASNLGARM